MDDFAGLLSPQTSTAANDELVRGASECLDRFTRAFNACDVRGMDSELHFPHIMFSGAERIVWAEPGQHPQTFFSALKATGWDRTLYDSKDAFLVVLGKVHFVVTYSRCDRSGSVLTRHTNLWIATQRDGKWGIALRSY